MALRPLLPGDHTSYPGTMPARRICFGRGRMNSLWGMAQWFVRISRGATRGGALRVGRGGPCRRNSAQHRGEGAIYDALQRCRGTGRLMTTRVPRVGPTQSEGARGRSPPARCRTVTQDTDMTRWSPAARNLQARGEIARGRKRRGAAAPPHPSRRLPRVEGARAGSADSEGGPPP